MYETFEPHIENGILYVSSWVKIGDMLYDRSALNPSDPNHIWNHLVSHGINPEEYGIEHPSVVEFKGKTRAELISEIVKLRAELDSFLKHGF